MSVAPAAAAAAATRWLELHGVHLERVAAQSFHTRGAGLGLVARSALAAGEVVLRVPRKCWWPFSAAAARERAVQSMPGAVERIDALDLGGSRHLADSTLLAAVIASQLVEGTDPGSYVREVPIELDVPALWPADLRGALLAGASCQRACESQAVLSDNLYRALVEGGGGPPLSLHQFRWGQALLLSRAHSGEGKPLALVPGLDLLNHAGSCAGARVRFSEDENGGSFELVAIRDHAVGDELRIDYGVRGSHQLLRQYGFVAPVTSAEPGSVGGSLAADEEVRLFLLPPGVEQPDGIPAVWDLRWASAPGQDIQHWEGLVELPLGDASTDPAETVRALQVLATAIGVRLEEQRAGYEASAAVRQMPGEAAGDVAARARALLSGELHETETRLLLAAKQQLAELGIVPEAAGGRMPSCGDPSCADPVC
jgi:hypothetical protein